MNWYKIFLKKDEVRKGELHKIIKLFCDILNSYIEIKYTSGVTMFESKKENTFIIYFTPASTKVPAIIDLINIYSGTICHPPYKGSVNYLAGDINYATRYL